MMLRAHFAAVACFAILLVSFDCFTIGRCARAQGATVQIRPGDGGNPSIVAFPDAVMCRATSPAGVTYRMIFYESQIASFGSEINNTADYGKTFEGVPEQSGASTGYVWHLQLGKPGAITMFAPPPGWHSEDCPVGKSIKDLIADKQALKIFEALPQQ